MNKFKTALKSRTTWTIVAMFLVAGVDGIRDLIPGAWLPAVEAALGLLAIYFRVNRRADQ